jgi:nucleoside-diphosphate-sugar epimerase
MRIVVLGGTRFIGRAIVDALLRHGHDVLVVHRGRHHTPGLPAVPHLHCDRRNLFAHRDQLAAFGADALIDTAAMTAQDAGAVLSGVPLPSRLLVLSSMDVYRAFTGVWTGSVTDAVPLTEDSPLRDGDPPDRGIVPPGYDYDPDAADNLLVEQAYHVHGATVCRLPMVYGPYDYNRREDFILRRLRAGRAEIPIGTGTFLWSRGYVSELAEGVSRAIEDDASAGETYLLCEAKCASIELWARQIIDAADRDAELVRVPDHLLPPDLELSGSIPQHLLGDPHKAGRRLSWHHGDPAARVADSVAWHLAQLPQADRQATDWSADDAALAARLT